MTKCDFCIQSNPNGECHWSIQAARDDDCKKAIEKMVKALGNNRNDTKRGKPFR